MNRVACCWMLAVALCVGCSPSVTPSKTTSLVQARQGHVTKLARRAKSEGPVDEPPASSGLRIEHYPAAVGSLPCYLSVDPGDGQKHPAIVWITGGDCNTIGDIWSPADPENDQTAVPYRKAGIVMMYPTLRGGNNSEGIVEGFYGEVDDVVAAADFLSKQSYVDPDRIYLGGHSTGGTLVLLVSECSDRFRAVFSFGPVDDIRGYGPEMTPISMFDRKEADLRSPAMWLEWIKSPTFVLEGMNGGNGDCLQNMAKLSQNPQVHFLPVQAAGHFDILDPLNRLIAEKILKDDGQQCNIQVHPTYACAGLKKRWTCCSCLEL